MHDEIKASGSHPGVALQDGRVDPVQGLVVRKLDVEDAEEGDESRIHVVSAPSCFTHGCHESQILQYLAVELFAPVVHSAAVQEQLEQSDGLLGTVIVHLESRENANPSVPGSPPRANDYLRVCLMV